METSPFHAPIVGQKHEEMEVPDNCNLGISESVDTELLRSRIDQQSELICILKKRADEYMYKYNAKEEELLKLNIEFENISNHYEEEQKRSKALESCYFNLGQTHQQLMSAKELVDAAVERLEKECELLKGENIQYLMKFDCKDATIKTLEESIVQKDNKIKNLEALDKENVQQFSAKQEMVESSILSMKTGFHGELDRLREEVTTTSITLSDVTNQLEASQKHEKDLESQLGVAMNMYASEKRRCAELEERLFKRSDKTTVSEKEALQRKINELEQKHTTVLQNFSAYKGHAQELLFREKSLNNKLRRLKSPDFLIRRDSTLTLTGVYEQ